MADRISWLLMMRKIDMEILAPVGGPEQLIAAVRCGADAVYLGAKSFNARRNAQNFEQTTLSETVGYCHARNVRVYVTVNTLVMDDELPQAIDTLCEIAGSGADAIIVQDLAIARLAFQYCPDIALHASTQMTIHNAAGASQLEALHFSRVVLARELTFQEIQNINQQANIALEVFVHGSLCMSVSGACYLSAMLGGRSGNRGLCAQPCRLNFTSGKRPYALSLKDLSAMQHLRALQQAGVQSLKIEGRMKRPEYVAATVTALKQALAEEPYDLDMLQAVFSREGFTDGYLLGKRDLSMFGIRTYDNVKATEKTNAALSNLYKSEAQTVPIRMELSLSEKHAALLATDGIHTVQISGDQPVQAQTPTDEKSAYSHLSKTGGTPFYVDQLSFHREGDIRLPAASLNAMRREALSSLLSAREAPAPKPFNRSPLPPIHPHQPSKASIVLRFESAKQLWDPMDAWRIVLPIDEITPEIQSAYGTRVVGELPALIFPTYEQRIKAKLSDLQKMGLRDVYVENLGALKLAKDAGMTPHGGHGLNILNTIALDAYASLGLMDSVISFELHHEKLRRLGGTMPRGAIAYGYLPLMRLRVCPAQGDCKSCNGHPELIDRTGATFSLLCHQKRYVTVLNSVPLSVTAEQLTGMDFHVLYFTNESKSQCMRIAECFAQGKTIDGQRTKGLYYRTLL